MITPSDPLVSPIKLGIYAGLIVTGIVLKLLHLPGNIILLTGCGLLHGHLAYKAIRGKGRKNVRRTLILLVTLLLGAMLLFSRYNNFMALALLVIGIVISLLMELLLSKGNHAAAS